MSLGKKKPVAGRGDTNRYLVKIAIRCNATDFCNAGSASNSEAE